MSFIIKSPLLGTLVDLESVSDPVFAQKMMGDGIAILPEDGKVISPIDGVLTTLFPTGHAYGITSDEGVEVLIHIGIDTVELKGKYFDIKVKQDQVLKAGDVLAYVNLKRIKKAGFQLVTPIILTSLGPYQTLEKPTLSSVSFGDTILTLK